MELKFLCPYCGRKLKADDDAAGKAVNCPDCAGEFLVPELPPGSTPPQPRPIPAPPPLAYAPQPNADGEHTCPVCWLRFDSGDIMHIAVHDSLRGDPVLGEDKPAAYHAEGILYLPTEARFDYLLSRPEAENIGMAKSEVQSVRHSTSATAATSTATTTTRTTPPAASPSARQDRSAQISFNEPKPTRQH